MRVEAVAVVLVVLVVGGLGVGYYIYQTSRPFCCPYTGSLTAYTASNPDLGIRLVISLNASTIHVGGSVNYTASVYNTRPSVNNVSSASDWADPRLVFTACGPTDSPIAYAVLPGHYVSGNLSEAPSMNYGMMCTTVMGGVTTYSLQPSSDVASVYVSSVAHCSSNPCFTRPISTSRVLSGYPSGVGAEVQWLNFKTGVYTVVAEDEWGDVALASFTVTSGSTSTQGSQQGGLQLSSIVMIQPANPGGPTLALTLRNLMGCCVTNLTAVLVLNSNFTFQFTGVSGVHPLDDQQYASAVETLIGGGFDSSKNYTLVIKGTTQDAAFTYAVQTRIPLGYSYLNYLTASASCTSEGQPAPCWGSDDPFVFQCVNLLAGPANRWICTEKVTSTIEPGQSYNITVTLPVTGQQGEASWDNCEWSVAGISPGQGYAYFIPVSSTGGSITFILANQASPHL